MKTYYQLLIFLLVFCLNNTSVMAEITGGITDPSDHSMELKQQQAVFSPRKYCASTGGKVRETNQNNIYLCCYREKQKCIVSDTNKTVSWSIPFSKYQKLYVGKSLSEKIKSAALTQSIVIKQTLDTKQRRWP